MAARPKTLPAAAAPVFIGAGLAVHDRVFATLPALAALVGALLIQIGTNLANDYYDFVRGSDTAERVGPVRVTQAGLLPPRAVWRGMVATLAAASLVGVYLVAVGGWPIVVVGVASLVCAVAYTGGPFPLGYHGLGDVFVFVFFGLVATIGSAYVHLDRVTGLSVLVAVPVGAAATALLVVNNLRDIPTDAAVGKNTLAVRWGPARTRQLYLRLMGLTVAGTIVAFIARPAVLLALLAVPLAISPVRSVAEGSSGSALIGVLGDTGRYQLAWGLLFAAGLWAGA